MQSEWDGRIGDHFTPPLRNTIYDPNAAGDVEAVVQLTDSELLIFNTGEKLLGRWPYAALRHAFALHDGKVQVLQKAHEASIRLTIADQGLYETIARRAPQLPGGRPGGLSLRTTGILVVLSILVMLAGLLAKFWR
jgi:hypothetical protein